ncbi:response regulator transcription factor [Planctomyces sp. SH-PL14]|uniref:response regulator transcription factor n=1 Tax=Planctomyces sp. SH-PL14 TaxID=1632864 RepID=UPI0018D3A196|nr:response regulator transcription factor [Planctomyces sp. SH-PL14]
MNGLEPFRPTLPIRKRANGCERGATVAACDADGAFPSFTSVSPNAMSQDTVSSDQARPSARIFLVDDYQAMRIGVAFVIASRPGWTVCGEAGGCLDALQMVRELQPDLAIVDLRLAQGDGLELIKTIRGSVPTCRMLVFSMLDEELFAERVLRAGAHGFVNKQESVPTLLEAIEKVLDGRIHLSPRMTDRILQRHSASVAEVRSPFDILSDREIEVFDRLGRGKSIKDIAHDLHISIKTVEYHRQNIKEKLHLPDGSAVIRLAISYVLGKDDRHAPSE